MQLTARYVTGDFPDADRLDRVNNEAFPAEERLETGRMFELAAAQLADLIAIYDGDAFVGFFLAVSGPAYAYVVFFAIDRAQRSKGYGGQALDLLNTLYPGRQLLLDIEPPDEVGAPNREQRVSRKQFYLRNGFRETGYLVRYLGMTFQILHRGAALDLETLRAAFEKTKPVLELTRPFAVNPVLCGP